MTQNQVFDRDTLHHLLWARSNHSHKLQIHQRTLAAEFGITHFTMSRAIRDLVADGAMRPISTGYHNVTTYVIADPGDTI